VFHIQISVFLGFPIFKRCSEFFFFLEILCCSGSFGRCFWFSWGCSGFLGGVPGFLVDVLGFEGVPGCSVFLEALYADPT